MSRSTRVLPWHSTARGRSAWLAIALASVLAAPVAHAASPGRQCHKACDAKIAQCPGDARARFDCKVAIIRACRRDGIETCLTPVTTTSTSTTSSSTTTSSTTSTTRPTTTTTTTRVPTTTSTSTSTTATTTTTTTPPDRSAPTSPRVTAVSPVSCGQLTVAWTAATDTGGSGLKAYNLFRNGVFRKQVVAPATLSAESGLAPSTQYAYAVSAVDNAGNESVRSAEMVATTPACPPPPNAPPRANAGPDQFVQTLAAATFDGSGSADDGAINAYDWTFGDGSSSTGKIVAHSYRTAGTFTATLTVTDNSGQRGTDTAVVTVTNRPPTANAGPDSTVGPGTPVAFDGRGSSDPDGTIASYAWSFGDGTTASGATASHAYGTAGTYTATLTVTDDLGARSSDSAIVTVKAGGGDFVWSRTFGGPTWTDNVVPQATTVAPNGNVIVVGYFAGTADFGAGAVTSVGGDDIFVAAYAAGDGHPLWSKHFGDTSHDFGTAVAVDGSGNIVVGGSFSGTVDFGGAALTSVAANAFLAKFSASGAHLWSKLLNAGSGSTVTGVAVDGAGTLFTTGTFIGTADFGTGAVTSAGQWDGYLLASGGADGRPLWSRRAGGSGIDTPRAVTVDTLGHVVVTGVFQNTADFGGGPLTSAGGYDVFLAQYATADGRHLWSKRFGDTGNDYGIGVDVDGAGNILLGGDFHGTGNFGGGALVDPSAASASYVAKFSSAGASVWSKMFTTDFYDVAMKGLTVDGSGSVVFTVATVGAIDCGGGMLPMSGGGDPVVAKLAGGGAHVWSTRFPSATQSYNASAGVAVDSSGNVLVAGTFTGTIDFGDGPESDPNGRVRDSFDGFLVKLAQ